MGNEDYRAPLDHFSEYAMSVETDDYPKTDWTQMQFKGPIDYAAFSQSYDEALAKVPVFNCNLTERRKGLFFDPQWVFNRDVKNRLVIEDCRSWSGEPFDPLEFSTAFHGARMRRRIDVRKEFPFRTFLVRVKDDVHILSIVYHHSVMDPAKAYTVVTTTLAHYHERVTGKKPEWAKALGMAMLKRKEGFIKPISMLTFAKDQLTDVFIRNTNRSVANIATRRILPPPDCMGRYSLRSIIEDPGVLAGLLKRAAHNKATLNDLLFACARKVITRWNQERDASTERFRFMLITSLMGRMALGEGAGAGLSGLNFVSRDHADADIDTITCFFRDVRKEQLRRGVDIQFYHTLRKIVQTFRVFPLRIRRNFVRPIIQRVPCTFYLSNLGTVWPKIVDGRQTMDSVVKGAGNFIIEDMHSSASISQNLGLGLTVRAHNQRFYLNFVCDRFRFERDEAQELTGRIIKEVINAGS